METNVKYNDPFNCNEGLPEKDGLYLCRVNNAKDLFRFQVLYFDAKEREFTDIDPDTGEPIARTEENGFFNNKHIRWSKIPGYFY